MEAFDLHYEGEDDLIN